MNIWKQQKFLSILFICFIGFFGMSFFATTEFGFTEFQQQMLFALSIFFLCLFVGLGIVKYLENSVMNTELTKHTMNKEIFLDISCIDRFLNERENRQESFVVPLHNIKEKVAVISPRKNEFDVEQQHHLEQMINHHLPGLLTHYHRFGATNKQTFKEQMFASLTYIEHTLEAVYMKQLNDYAVQQFNKTNRLLVK